MEEKKYKHKIKQLKKIDWREIPPDQSLSMAEVAAILGVKKRFPTSHVRTLLVNLSEEKNKDFYFIIKKRYYTNINLLQEAIPAFFKQNHKELTHITTVRADLSNTNSKITNINKTLVNFKESLDEYDNRLKSLENTVKELLNHIKSISPKQERQPSYQEIMKQKLEEEKLKRMKG